jgi:protein SCO1/2
MNKGSRHVAVWSAIGMAFQLLAAGHTLAAEPLPLDIGADFVLTDQRGKIRSSDEFDGKLKLVWFGYTECPHTCSMALGSISAALDELGGDADAVAPLFVTVDPGYDTPARLATHLANFHPSFVGLTGTPEDIARLQAGYRTAATQIADPGQFKRLFEHTTLIYLMGRDGEPMSILPATLPPDRIAAIVQGYL